MMLLSSLISSLHVMLFFLSAGSSGQDVKIVVNGDEVDSEELDKNVDVDAVDGVDGEVAGAASDVLDPSIGKNIKMIKELMF